MPLTPAERRLYGRAGAHQSWANTANRTQRTSAARAASRDKLAAQIDPAGELDPAELEVRIQSAIRARMAILAAKSVKARAAKSRLKGSTTDHPTEAAS